MNYLIFGDIHITEKDIKECESVLNEIITLKEKYKVNKIILTGDTFDKVNPTSIELDLFSDFIKKLNIPIIILVAQSHESITPTESILNHFGILKNNLKIVKEYIDENHLYVGHFTLQESKMHFGSKKSKKEFEKYKYVILGHQHTFEIIKPNIVHIGSIRYVDFAESQDKQKVVLLMENYKEKNEKCHFLSLNSPIPMKDVYLTKKTDKPLPQSSYAQSIEELKAILDKIDSNTKVRVIFDNFEGYKNFRPLYEIYKKKFKLFKDRKDFTMNYDSAVSGRKDISLKDSFNQFLKINKINEDIKEILLKEMK